MFVEVGEASDVRSLLDEARGVLFDFDGPVCRLFPNGSSRPVANALRCLVAKAGVKSLLTAEEKQAKDPHAVLRAVHRGRREDTGLVGALEREVTKGELEAVRRAELTPGADELIRRLARRGQRLAVVTNNSAEAVSYYLESKGLSDCFTAVHGRTSDIDRMKPAPHVVEQALQALQLCGPEAVMIGDSEADVHAAQSAGVPFVGFGRNERKEAELRRAGAKLVLNSYARLLDEE
ncbi:HAD family hydrolase [Streptomyces sp. DG2A-72]|uniref:HAD family hydrolase n=1 Tax=Streptomyces sp. DG2A-72 TaxID=3051386 RepID=UPI00265BEC61|nr:HAD family hydrolase [Streptomyces sp. DG2A-72]MDO0934248.1 HAD family hydrolase [Streptomyces sp. DG2A-72]